MNTEPIARFWDSRTKEAELNYAIFAFAARCVTEGDFEALREVGFEPDDVQIIDQLRLSDLHALAASRAHPLNVRVNREALQWLIEHVRRRRTREILKLELLRLDAPSEMMANLFGITVRTYTAMRDALGIEGGQGRPASRLEDDRQEERLWHLWVLFADGTRPQKLRHEDLWLLIGRELDAGLRDAWNIIQQWSREEQHVQSLCDKRSMLTGAQLAHAETLLRVKHHVYPTEIGIPGLRPTAITSAEPLGFEPESTGSSAPEPAQYAAQR